MKLQARDKKIIAGIYKFGVLSTRQIGNLFFKSVAHTTVMKRLRRLEEMKFISRGVTLKNGTNTWRLDVRGRRLLGLEESFKFSNRNTIEHDVLLNDLRMTFEVVGLGLEWTPECVMKAGAFRHDYKKARNKVIPDGLMAEMMNGKALVIAVELELTQKSQSRYRETFTEYANKNLIDIIWYFIKDKGLVHALQTGWQKQTFRNDRQHIFVSYIDDFFKNKKNSKVFFLRDSRFVSLSDLAFDVWKTGGNKATQGVSNQTDQNLNTEIADNPSPSQINSEKQKTSDRPLIASDPTPPTNTGGLGSEAVAGEEGTGKDVMERGYEKCG